MYNGYLDRCISSDIMREYLKEQKIMIWQALDIIEGAPISINIKLEELKKILESIKNTDDIENLRLVENAIERLNIAISLLDYDGFFTVEQVYFGYDAKEPPYGLEKVCSTYYQVPDILDHWPNAQGQHTFFV